MPTSKTPALVVASCLALLAVACRRSRPGPAPATVRSAPAPALALLPDAIADFAAGPIEREGGGVRRRYSRAATQIVVTLARLPMTDGQYAEWVKTSVA